MERLLRKEQCHQHGQVVQKGIMSPAWKGCSERNIVTSKDRLSRKEYFHQQGKVDSERNNVPNMERLFQKEIMYPA